MIEFPARRHSPVELLVDHVVKNSQSTIDCFGKLNRIPRRRKCRPSKSLRLLPGNFYTFVDRVDFLVCLIEVALSCRNRRQNGIAASDILSKPVICGNEFHLLFQLVQLPSFSGGKIWNHYYATMSTTIQRNQWQTILCRKNQETSQRQPLMIVQTVLVLATPRARPAVPGGSFLTMILASSYSVRVCQQFRSSLAC